MRACPLIHQFTAVYAERDAVGQHTLAVHSLLRDMGYTTVLFAERAYRNSKIEVVPFRKHIKYPSPDMIIYQLSTGSSVGEYLTTRSEPLVLNYHNITPSEYYHPWAPHIAHVLDKGREQLAALANFALAGVADSQYNAEELYDLGMSNVSVVPIILEPTTVPPASESIESDTPVLLFVGRLAPNKRIEHLISALALLQQKWKRVQLVIAGTSIIVEYESALRKLVDRLNLNESVEFTGSISEETKDAYYAAASVYVSASVHEGFCVPLVEAMNAGLPVVAYESTAVPETIGNAGVLLDGNDPLSFAKAIDMVLDNRELRNQLSKRGFRRASRFAPVKVRHEMRDTVASLVGDV